MSPCVLQRRGGHVEAVHPFSAVAVQGRQVVGRLGPPITSTWRSAAKPFQLWCSWGALDEAPCSDQELAVGAASHAGQPEHVALVRGLLARFGVPESALACGGHAPLWGGAHEELIRSGQAITDVHNNCSGKHTFMVAGCRNRGWGGDYRGVDHPLQQAIRELVRRLAGEAPLHGVDGCGVPSWVLSIEGMARAWSHLAESFQSGEPRLHRIGAAMMAHPHLTSGSGRLDEELMAGRREAMVVKIGAQGLFSMAFPERGMGVTVKVHSGSGDALGVALEHSLAELVPGAWERPEGWRWGTVLNVAGRPVGDRVLG